MTEQSDGGRWLGLEGKRVLVFGAGAFGRACISGFLRQGATVLAVDRDRRALADVISAASSDDHGSRLHQAEIEVRASADCRKVAGLAADLLGGLDVLVHAVGTNDRREVRDIPDDSWDEVIHTNLTSAFWLSRECIDLLRASSHGKMVFFSSVSSSLAHPRHGAYAASKGGLDQLIRVLAVELAGDGIHVNGIAPGYVETGLTAHYLAKPGVREDLESRVPMGRLGAVEDVVGPVLFLSSPRSSFVTGRVIVVDGGRSLD